ncbi:hypothetical protein M436DRAFT_72092 [Aureobasidium namibiae CBS 147.97]|uniref:Uncharacterized protein n=1 Tax=Aureobasidium namibiae CBS 147.97 TaxID=1043004 RepID=A0A074WVC2_9PEZI|nr:uncharacterized protein M436DRAFT_72092 [Aureobasidium namibiae CBS 147.97]KEQ73677.1 hypothetical protein M436DRAFT_72092 [Aureobasidium namibiae CBS 147.97]
MTEVHPAAQRVYRNCTGRATPGYHDLVPRISLTLQHPTLLHSPRLPLCKGTLISARCRAPAHTFHVNPKRSSQCGRAAWAAPSEQPCVTQDPSELETGHSPAQCERSHVPMSRAIEQSRPHTLSLDIPLSMRFSVWFGTAPSLASIREESSCSLQRTRTVSAHHLTQDSTNATWGLAFRNVCLVGSSITGGVLLKG